MIAFVAWKEHNANIFHFHRPVKFSLNVSLDHKTKLVSRLISLLIVYLNNNQKLPHYNANNKNADNSAQSNLPHCLYLYLYPKFGLLRRPVA